MTWFVVQRLYTNASGQVATEYVGPFYGDPTKILPLLTVSDFVLVYNNGSWSDLPRPA